MTFGVQEDQSRDLTKFRPEMRHINRLTDGRYLETPRKGHISFQLSQLYTFPFAVCFGNLPYV